MRKVQSLENKKGEVDFRRKLAIQFDGKATYYKGEPTDLEYRSIVKDRIRDYTGYFEKLKKNNIPLGLYLELGGGVGQGAMLLENKFNVHGFTSDISLETLKLGDKYLNYLDYKKMPIRICADIYNLPFRSEGIPFIFTFQMLHHLPDPKPILEEVKRVLAPNGYFYFNEEPIAQIFNLNLWRRDRHLRWFEKILKVFVVLHFISRIGKSETEHDILEETFSLPVWEKALNIFKRAHVTIKAFPYGPTVRRNKMKRSGWIRPPFIKRVFLNILGGGIEALCQKEHDRKWRRPHYTTVFDLLACPNCRHKPKLTLQNNQTLLCQSCLSVYKKTNGIFMLFSKDQLKTLYPNLSKNI